MKYEIYQIKDELTREFGFMGLGFILGKYGEVDKSNYNKVYETEEDSDIQTSLCMLDYIYHIYNVAKPQGFNGRSLSVSDVVVLDGEAYYCDDFGWKQIEF